MGKDDNKRIKPTSAKKPRSGLLRSDRTLTIAGIALAAAAAAFPWYVFFNEEKFGISVAGWEQLRDFQGNRRPEVANARSLDFGNGDDATIDKTPASSVDPLTTATVAKPGTATDDDGAADAQQPFPGSSGFRLLHVVNGRAMIEDNTGMYMVQVGSVLPDNSRLAALQQQAGKWVLVTSTGAVYPGQP